MLKSGSYVSESENLAPDNGQAELILGIEVGAEEGAGVRER
jgi:hypothetical protein